METTATAAKSNLPHIDFIHNYWAKEKVDIANEVEKVK